MNESQRLSVQRTSAYFVGNSPSPSPSIVQQPRRMLVPSSSTEDFTLVAVDQHPADISQAHSPPYPSVFVASKDSLATARPTIGSHVPALPADQEVISPSASTSGSATRHSSRRALTEALRLAQEAVLLDSQNDDPVAAFRAYARSVALLNQVMEKVMSGDRDGEQSRRPGRSRSDVAREDEARRLKSIHDTYAERMRILADIYPIPDELPPTSPLEPYHPIMRPAPSNAVTVQEPHLEQQMDAMSVSSDPEDSAPSTPTLSERQMSSESVHIVSPGSSQDGSTAVRDRPPSPHPNSHRVPSAGRSSYLPPARPPPTGPPPSRPRAASATAPATAERIQKPSILAHEEPSARLWSFISPEASRAATLSTQWQQSGAAVGESTSPPLPPLPEPSPRPSPITPRADVRTSRGAPSPENTPRQRNHLSRVVEERLDARPTLERDSASASGRLVNATTSEGTISQRRNRATNPLTTTLLPQMGGPGPVNSMPPVVKLSVPLSVRENLGNNRLRASSQPGTRPSHVTTYPTTVLVDGVARAPSRTSHLSTNIVGGPGKVGHLSPLQTQGLNVGSPPFASRSSTNLPTVPTSPLPPPSPSDPVRKPYHLMALLKLTMISKTGGYITRKLHVPHEVWSQGGAKLSNLPEKVRMVDVLSSALEELQLTSAELCGPQGGVARSPPIAKSDFDRWLNKLEDWANVCEGVVGNMGKKLGVGEGFAAKKGGTMTTWSSKFARSLDKLTNGKNLDSPAAYVAGLAKLFQQAQTLDEHNEALTSPNATVYLNIPSESRTALDARLKQSSEFFATVVLTFVIRDLSLLLDKYAKKGGQWLSE